MAIAKDGSITSPVGDIPIPGLSFQREERGDAQEGGPIAEIDRHSQPAQVKSRGKKR